MEGNTKQPTTNQSLKGYRTYYLPGIDTPIKARKGGPSSEEVKNKASYGTLRNNQKEFGIASMMAKTLRSSLQGGMAEICESYVSGRLTAKFRHMAMQEPGNTGQRPIFPSKYGHLVSGFEFNPDCPYKQIFGAHYFVKNGSRRGQVILHFPSFIPMEAFQCPEDATNFKINARLVALSDFIYDKEKDEYKPQNEQIHGTYGSFESLMLPLLKIPLEPMTAQVAIPDVLNMDEHVGVFLVLAVSFYKYEKGQFHHLSKHSGMQIHQVN